MAIFFIERAILIFANAIIEPFFGRIEQKLALFGSFYKRHPVDYKIFIFLGQPLSTVKNPPGFKSKWWIRVPIIYLGVLEQRLDTQVFITLVIFVGYTIWIFFFVCVCDCEKSILF